MLKHVFDLQSELEAYLLAVAFQKMTHVLIDKPQNSLFES